MDGATPPVLAGPAGVGKAPPAEKGFDAARGAPTWGGGMKGAPVPGTARKGIGFRIRRMDRKQMKM